MRGEVVAGRETEPRIAPIIREMQSNTQVANSRPSGAHRVLSPSGEGSHPLFHLRCFADSSSPSPPATSLAPSFAKPYVQCAVGIPDVTW